MGKTNKSDRSVSRLIQAIRKYGTLDSLESVVREMPAIRNDHALLADALFESSRLDKPEIVKWLLDNGAPIYCADRGRTPLMVTGSREVAEALCAEDSELLNLADEDGRTALMQTKSVDVAKFLVQQNAKLNEVDKLGNTALLNVLLAKETSHRTTYIEIAKLLIDKGADVNAADRQGRTVIITAIWKSYIEVVECLVQHPKLDLMKLDVRGRNVLHHFCQDAKRVSRYSKGDSAQHDQHIIELLLGLSVDINLREQIEGKPPLQCALISGNKLLVDALLNHDHPPNVNALDYRDKSALHIAAANGQHEVVEKLICEHKASVDVKTKDGWEPLHYAAAGIGDSVETVRALLSETTDMNSETRSGRTALHIAAETGNVEVLRHLLTFRTGSRGVNVTKRDVFGNSALVCAAKPGHRDIVGLLAPYSGPALGAVAQKAAEEIKASVVDFEPERRNRPRHTPRRVFDLIFGSPPVSLEQEKLLERRDSITDSQHEEHPSKAFRWVHLPANNVFWCRGILIKLFLEDNGIHGETKQALLKSFDHNHKGKHLHARYMRPTCHYTPPNRKSAKHVRRVSGLQNVNAEVSDHVDDDDGRLHHNFHASGRKPCSVKSVPANRRKRGYEDTLEDVSTITGPSETWKQDPAARDALSGDDKADSIPNSMYVFMPYLHFESFRDRTRMHRAVRRAQGHPAAGEGVMKMAARAVRDVVLQPPIVPFHKRMVADEKLIHAHTTPENPTLQIRRTLDQFFYRTIDTTERDKDQVVHRHQIRVELDRLESTKTPASKTDLNKAEADKPEPNKPDLNNRRSEKTGQDANILMVDQLWMWIVNESLVITSFPRRWGQDNDDHGVWESIYRDVQSNTAHPVSDVYELAMIIAGHCFGWIDRRDSWHDETLFLDMFESSIGHAMNEEVRLFKAFRKATKEASSWLRKIKGFNSDTPAIEAPRTPHISIAEDDEEDEDFVGEKHGSEPNFVQTLLDIGDETRLLEDVKDIRDELDMLRMIYNQQKELVPDIEKHILSILKQQKDTKSRQDRMDRIKQLHEEQMKYILNPLRDIERMDQQAERIYHSIRDLLDLKQKHANAMQATETQRQGKTLMVFTIVTVVFLPLSFLAAFFAINVTELPHDAQGHIRMSIAYVSKYIFGIGAAIALMCVGMAWYAEKVDIQRMNVQRWVWRQARALSGGLWQVKKKATQTTNQRTNTNLSTNSEELYVFDAEKQERRASIKALKKAQQAIELVRTRSAN